jgi:hypothetical protein
VVPDLGGVVEDPRLVRLAGRGVDDGFERLAFEIGALDQVVEVFDIGLVMLAVVKAERVGRDDRIELVVGVGERRKREHGGLAPEMSEGACGDDGRRGRERSEARLLEFGGFGSMGSCGAGLQGGRAGLGRGAYRVRGVPRLPRREPLLRSAPR